MNKVDAVGSCCEDEEQSRGDEGRPKSPPTLKSTLNPSHLDYLPQRFPPISPDQMRNECGQDNTGSGNGEDEEVLSGTYRNLKEGMTFDSLDEAYIYYSRFAKEEGFTVIKRTARKGTDGNLSYVTLACSRGGKEKVATSNPVRPRPQSRMGCPARINLAVQRDRKWRLNRIILEHNHDQSPSKVKYLKCNRVIDEHAKKRLELNDRAGINLNKTYCSLQIEAGGPGDHGLDYSTKYTPNGS